MGRTIRPIKSIKYRGYRILNRVSIRENIEGNDDIWGEGEAIIHKGVITAMVDKSEDVTKIGAGWE